MSWAGQGSWCGCHKSELHVPRFGSGSGGGVATVVRGVTVGGAALATCQACHAALDPCILGNFQWATLAYALADGFAY